MCEPKLKEVDLRTRTEEPEILVSDDTIHLSASGWGGGGVLNKTKLNKPVSNIRKSAHYPLLSHLRRGGVFSLRSHMD